MMEYTMTELAEILREYSCMGLSPDESLALAEHVHLLVQANQVVPPMSPRYVAEWRTYATLAEAAEAAGLEYAEGLPHAERETMAREYFVAVADRWAVVEIGWGVSYLMRERGGL